MCARSILLAVSLLLAASWMPALALAQVGDKKKEAEKITAETKVAGRTLSEWIEVISKRDRSETEIAIKNILIYPSDLAAAAVPVIIAELKKHTVANPIDMSVRLNGAIALGHVLSTAKPASLKDPKDPKRDLVNEGVEQLQKMLADKQVMVRFRAAQALGLMGIMAKKAIPALCTLAGDNETWETRYQAVLALGPVSWHEKDPPPPQVIKTLFIATSYKSEPAARVRLAALDTLANLHVGTFDKEDKQKYRARLEDVCSEDVNALVRLRAHLMIWPFLTDDSNKPIAAARKKHHDALERFLANTDLEVRLALISGLAALAPEKEKKGEPQKQLVNIIYKAMDDKEAVVRMEALLALAHLKMGDFDRLNYMAILDQAAKRDTAAPVQLNAYSWIFPLLKPGEKQAYGKALGGMLKNVDPAVKVETCKVIAHIGEDAAATLPDLIKGLNDKDQEVVHWCIFALGHLEKSGQPALPVLEKIAATSTLSADVRETAQDAINIITGKEKLNRPKKDDK
jgi:HEAT repeat protein